MEPAVSQSKRFGHYEIVRKLGRGMTDVYLAFDPRIQRRVILKLIEEARDEYTQLVIGAEKRGAQIQTDLHRVDSRVLDVYEFGFAENCFFVSMEYFEGKNIAEILQIQRRLDPKVAAGYAVEVSNQLSRLHAFVSDVDGRERAVVHGDIKPSNIQIGTNGQVRLLDFGIAKVITSTRNLTRHNLGSPTYCSPERLSKGQVDAQADLWALGVSLYEMVAGTPPYQAQDTRKLEMLIQSKRPPRSLPETCPPALGAIINKALAGDISQRYRTANDFERDLRGFLNGQAPPVAPGKGPTWENNATIQKFRPEVLHVEPHISPRPAASFGRRFRIFRELDWFRLGAIVFGLFAVFLLAYLTGRFRDQFANGGARLDYSRASVATIDADWARYAGELRREQFLGKFSPALGRGKQIETALVNAADEVIDSWRSSSNPSLTDFNWEKAQACLRHALEIDSGDRANTGKLALCNGFLNLIRNPTSRAELSERDFQDAAALLPRGPEPHLALARLYVYSYQNPGRALAELRAAERLGYRVGPREAEEEGDGYRFRAESELLQAQKAPLGSNERARAFRLMQADFDRARSLYEPILGFSNVSQSIRKIDQDLGRASVSTGSVESPKPKLRAARHTKVRKKKAKSRGRWR